MNISALNNENGFTIVELLTAMIISAVLLAAVVSGTLFVNNFLNRETNYSHLQQEMSFMFDELEEEIRACHNLSLRDHVLKIKLKDGRTSIFDWSTGKIRKNGRLFLKQSITIDSISITPIDLQTKPQDSILNMRQVVGEHTLYRIYLQLSDEKYFTIHRASIVRNDYAYFKKQ